MQGRDRNWSRSGTRSIRSARTCRLGARVVVSDLPVASGAGTEPSGADQVAEEIRALGGEALVHYGDVSDWDSAEVLIARTVEELGGLDILVNNAGISRPAMSFNMTEQDWDDVVRVHLKGTFAPTRFAAAYWREQAKAGSRLGGATVVNTSSPNGLNGGTPGHVNYSVAKTGINTITTALARELAPYGVRCNAVAPLAYTSMTESLWGTEILPSTRRPELEPANVAAVVGWLASPDSDPVTAKVLAVVGSKCVLWNSWAPVEEIHTDGAWTFDQIAESAPALFKQVDAGLPLEL